MTSPAFDFRATRLPANVRYVGPVIDDRTEQLVDHRMAGAGRRIDVV